MAHSDAMKEVPREAVMRQVRRVLAVGSEVEAKLKGEATGGEQAVAVGRRAATAVRRAATAVRRVATAVRRAAGAVAMQLRWDYWEVQVQVYPVLAMQALLGWEEAIVPTCLA